MAVRVTNTGGAESTNAVADLMSEPEGGLASGQAGYISPEERERKLMDAIGVMVSFKKPEFMELVEAGNEDDAIDLILDAFEDSQERAGRTPDEISDAIDKLVPAMARFLGEVVDGERTIPDPPTQQEPEPTDTRTQEEKDQEDFTSLFSAERGRLGEATADADADDLLAQRRQAILEMVSERPDIVQAVEAQELDNAAMLFLDVMENTLKRMGTPDEEIDGKLDAMIAVAGPLFDDLVAGKVQFVPQDEAEPEPEYQGPDVPKVTTRKEILEIIAANAAPSMTDAERKEKQIALLQEILLEDPEFRPADADGDLDAVLDVFLDRMEKKMEDMGLTDDEIDRKLTSMQDVTSEYISDLLNGRRELPPEDTAESVPESGQGPKTHGELVLRILELIDSFSAYGYGSEQIKRIKTAFLSHLWRRDADK